ncbi:hypothetical protein [Lederbergia lenta]|uniref:Relaxasome subunit MobC n=1 Tax=Lederbergia lenta TaxID=1467 RepID=A0A2X4W405_LEDLE|nr:hypothetical protein [Lederbergia lenta]MCM3110757.1 hypothetical protein [Lederbergia lenta]MEC2325847.1 hypothetical protein [Lederbergia lenta]SQI53662.1 Uncharacterised protein [Lederbergia lenta]
MTTRTDEDRLKELDEQMEKIKARKQQIANRMRDKERKARTKRLIEVGAIFEKHFEFEGQEDAEKIALALSAYVANNKEKLLSLTKEELKEKRIKDKS